MPDNEEMLEWLDNATDWVELFASELMLGLIVAIGLMFWIWKGREPKGTVH